MYTDACLSRMLNANKYLGIMLKAYSSILHDAQGVYSLHPVFFRTQWQGIMRAPCLTSSRSAQ